MVIYKKTLFSLVCILGFLILGISCTDESPFESDRNESPQKTSSILLTISNPGQVRSSSTGNRYLNGTKEENEINTLTVFIVPTNESGTEYRGFETFHKTIQIPSDQAYGLTYNITIEYPGNAGRKNIYVGANMREEQIWAFAYGRPHLTYEAESHREVMEKVMDIEGADTEETGSNILMFSEQKSSILITTPGEIHDAGQINLKRVVSKVLLTFHTTHTTDDSKQWIELKDKNEASAEELGIETAACRGWADIGEAYYMLNVTNKTLMLYPETSTIDNTTTTYTTDANWNISDHLTPTSDGHWLINNQTDYKNDFHFLEEETIVMPEGGFHPFTQETLWRHPLPYDVARMEETELSDNPITDANYAGNHYTEGIYCLENLVSGHTAEWEWSDNLTKDDAAYWTTTHLWVAIRYTPRYIHHLTDEGTIEAQSATDIEQARSYFSEILDEQGNILYPEGTYWLSGEKDYYTYSAMQKMLQEGSSPDDFLVYIGGFNYFMTYIDGDNVEGTISYESADTWGLERNTYYILTAVSVILPGANRLLPDMRINSLKLDWNPRGGTSIVVKP